MTLNDRISQVEDQLDAAKSERDAARYTARQCETEKRVEFWRNELDWLYSQQAA